MDMEIGMLAVLLECNRELFRMSVSSDTVTSHEFFPFYTLDASTSWQLSIWFAASGELAEQQWYRHMVCSQDK